MGTRRISVAAAIGAACCGAAWGQISVGTNVNISRATGNQCEGAIAVNPTNPQRLFIASNLDSGAGLFGGVSTNGGATWTTRTVATGSDGIAAACCDPSASFDSFGNLFLCYINSAATAVVVARSSDSGATFSPVTTFTGSIDQPTINTGPGTVWVTYFSSSGIVARGATVTGLGVVGAFAAAQSAPSSSGGNFGDIVIGPGGQVAVTYQATSPSQGPSSVFFNIDADGLGAGGFGARTTVTSTNVGGFDAIPPQPSRTIDAEAGLAWDRTGGAHNGRLYLVYTDETVNESNNTDIMLRFSDNNGATWSAANRLNTDATTRSQFFPKIALDPATGHIAVVWYDARNDAADVLCELWGTASVDGGATFLPNVRISQGASNGTQAHTGNGIEFGDYLGLTMYNNVFYPVWADSSNSTGDNPNGAAKLDMYTARVAIVCTADCDGNGLIQPVDVACFINTWSTSLATGTLAGDFDHNGAVQPADVAVFVSTWFAALSGPCP